MSGNHVERKRRDNHGHWPIHGRPYGHDGLCGGCDSGAIASRDFACDHYGHNHHIHQHLQLHGNLPSSSDTHHKDYLFCGSLRLQMSESTVTLNVPMVHLKVLRERAAWYAEHEVKIGLDDLIRFAIEELVNKPFPLAAREKK